MLLCHGAEPEHTTDIELSVGKSPFGLCKSLLGSGIFARSVLVPLSLGKNIAATAQTSEQIKIVTKGLKRHFGVKPHQSTVLSNWVNILHLACSSLRFLRAFDETRTQFSAGWFKDRVEKAISLPTLHIVGKVEHIASGYVTGFAYHEADASKDITLDFFINDTFVGSSKTGGIRRDIQEITGGDGQYEFTHNLTLPRHLSARDDLFLSIFEHSSGTLICPAMEYAIVDIRHTIEIQKLIHALQNTETTDVKTTQYIKKLGAALPAVEHYAAIPLENYTLYKQLYTVSVPPSIEGVLPNISTAKPPDYTYNPKADVIVFLDEGDRLLDGAAAWIEHAAHTETDAFLFFGDYETVGADRQVTPHHRTPFDKDMFLANPSRACAYAVRRQHLEEVGGLNPNEPAPHAALWLRLLARCGEKGFHLLPHTLWSLKEPSHDTGLQNLLTNYFDSIKTKTTVSSHTDKYGGGIKTAFDLAWPLNSDMPKLAIIIPTRDALELTRNCVESLRNTLQYPEATEIIIVDNGSKNNDTKEWLHWVDGMDGFRVLLHDAPFNWAEINNKAVAESDAEYVLFLNNDTVALDQGWDHTLRGYLNRADVGTVGARLLFEDGSIQFAGYIADTDNIALKEAYGESPDEGGYDNRSKLPHACSALIGAFMACRRDIFKKAGGFDAEHFPIAFNDIDFCLTIGELGYKNLYVPAITFHHLESKSRGYDAQDPEKTERETFERDLMRKKWATRLENDPWYPSAFLKKEPTHSLLAAPRKASITGITIT